METVRFDELNLHPKILKGIQEMGFEEATPIQGKAIPVVMEGVDVIGQAQTGTGKTAAFGIPLLMKADPHNKKTQSIVLCPTRELAIQVAEEIRNLAKYMHGIKVLPVYGGQDIVKQIRSLKGGAQIIIGTPGRVMDHLRRKTIRCDYVNTIVLDEADEMLNMGFREDIETVLEYIPEERQTVLFSATMPKAIMDITKEYQTNPVLVAVGSEENRTAVGIEQFYFDCPMGRKMDVLNLLLAKHEPRLSIVFCNTKKMVDELSEYLNSAGYKAIGIHGDMKQSARTQVMNSFKSHRTRILIATDVAARGIDVENVDAVFNFDIPQDTEYYVHRIGRTARAGKEGRAYTLISGRRQFFQLRDIMSSTGAKIQKAEIPSAEEIYHSRSLAFAEKLMTEAAAPSQDSREVLEHLTQQGFTTEQAALGAITLLLAGSKKNLPQVQVVSRKGDAQGRGGQGAGLSGVILSVGRKQRIAPNFILGAIADATGLPGKSIGKIDIYDDYTVVQMDGEDARLTAETMATCRINGNKTEVRIIGKEDKLPRGRGQGQKFPKGKPYGRVDGFGRRTDSRRGGKKGFFSGEKKNRKRDY